MNHQPRSYDPLPARQSELTPAPTHGPGRHELEEYAPHEAAPSGQKITPKLIVRALRRHWWQAAIVWIIGSIGVMALTYTKVKPSYLAFARVKVEPGERGIITTARDETSAIDTFKETQVAIITQPTVIEAAINKHPEILHLPKLIGSEDPVPDVRALLSVGIVPKTNLIEISASSESFEEARQVVDAVVEAYLKGATDSFDRETAEKIKHLRTLSEEQNRDMSLKRDAIKEYAKKLGNVDPMELKKQNSGTVEDYQRLSVQISTMDAQITDLEGDLAQFQGDLQGSPATAESRSGDQELERLFRTDSRVIAASERLDRAVERYERARVGVRDLTDPSIQHPLKEKRAASKQLDDLWNELYPTLLAQVRSGTTRLGSSPAEAEQKKTEIRLSTLKTRRDELQNRLEQMDIKNKKDGYEAIKLEFDREDLARASRHFDAINNSLTDIEFSQRNPTARVHGEFTARPGKATSNRLKIMAVAPIGVLAGVLGLLVLLELHAGRVVDPEDLPNRVRVPVIGVVPPLPQVRPQAGLFSAKDEFRTQRQLDQFVQSLDHLRVALTSGRDAWGRERRVILITSACGSEGKTTLAAQLAERCVNAGLHTLLVDGDLRNPTLSRMLDVPNSRGLINVLRGEVNPSEAIAVVGGAGGFSFMPAGTPKVDPSRLLQGDRLGTFLAEAREGFDIVIVDAPPVLPVPDALTIGRWADGAVLAVRYDTSRFPLVEKANRRLATVGVSVIGAVVNGVRVSESTYGSYYPSYAYSNERDSGTPLDV